MANVPKQPKQPGKSKNQGGVPKIPGQRNIPWLGIAGGVTVLALVAGIGTVLYNQNQDQEAVREVASAWSPSADDPDPAMRIDGVTKTYYQAALHIVSPQRVAYDKQPPYGGPHDANWADCTGTVYSTAIRTENAVHALEHGAVWIAYNPDRVSGSALDSLEDKVDGINGMMLSPVPDLDPAVSLQAWGHQLKLEDPADPRIDEFKFATLMNRNVGVYDEDPTQSSYPEVGASCSNPNFLASPEPYDPSEPGPDAAAMDGAGTEVATDEGGSMTTDPSPSGSTPAVPSSVTPSPVAPSSGAPSSGAPSSTAGR